MSMFLGILAAAVLGGGFTVYPGSGDSSTRMAIAIILWIVGVVLAIVAGCLVRKKPQDTSGDKAVDPRESLKQMLVDEYAKGVEIKSQHYVADSERLAPPWQAKVAALLKESLDSSDCWRNFEQMGREPGNKLPNQLSEQTRYLEEIVQNFSDYNLKATWRPPTPRGHRHRLPLLRSRRSSPSGR